MDSLGDAFPDSFKKSYAETSVTWGSVIALYDGEAEKLKYHVIVGFDDNKILAATVRINSEINRNFYNRPELVDLCHPISSDKIDFLDHDSFVACDKIIEWERQAIVDLVNNDPKVVLGQLEIGELEIIQYKISTAVTISAKRKKKYGLFLK
ncbi:MAG: hypothetical protein AB7D05_11085 [Mangrovibacterium sp.]